VQVVLTDLAMPGSMDGLQFAELLGTRYPGLPVLLTTGHLDPFRGRRLPGGVMFVQKPYSRDRIASVLRQSLRARSRPVSV
jgi:FixJ family two-component response regulator